VRRREVLAGVFAMATPAATGQTVRKARVGFIGNDPGGGGEWAKVLWQKLGEFGWREGENLTVRAYWVFGEPDRARAAAVELVAAGVDLIVAVNAIYVEATRRVTSTIPIVFTSHGDPVGARHIANLGRPGGNVTGVTHMQPEVTAKGVEVLREAVPDVKRIAVLWSPEAPPHHLVLPKVLDTARRLDVVAMPIPVIFGEEMAEVMARVARENVQGIVIIQGPVFSPHFELLARLSLQARLPTISTYDSFAPVGGLLSFGADFTEMHRRAAVYVDRILRGARPADLPVEQPTKFLLGVNLATARALGLTFPPSFLMRADEIIE
jgi:putative ABC transport system substrate-binding protein